MLTSLGLFVLAAGLLAIGSIIQFRRHRRSVAALMGLAAIMILLIAVADQISIPKVFTNGTIADTDEVSENFGFLRDIAQRIDVTPPSKALLEKLRSDEPVPAPLALPHKPQPKFEPSKHYLSELRSPRHLPWFPRPGTA